MIQCWSYFIAETEVSCKTEMGTWYYWAFSLGPEVYPCCLPVPLNAALGFRQTFSCIFNIFILCSLNREWKSSPFSSLLEFLKMSSLWIAFYFWCVISIQALVQWLLFERCVTVLYDGSSAPALYVFCKANIRLPVYLWHIDNFSFCSWSAGLVVPLGTWGQTNSAPSTIKQMLHLPTLLPWQRSRRRS